MRILIISGAFPPMCSGEAANTAALASKFVERGIDVHILTKRQSDLTVLPGVTLHPEMRTWSFAEAPTMVRVFKRVMPDAIVLMFLGGIYEYHPMITFAPTIARRVLPGRPFIARFENPYSLAMPELTSWPARFFRKVLEKFMKPRVTYGAGTLLRDSDSVVVLCERHRELLLSLDASVSDRLRIIPPPCNVEHILDPDGQLRTQGRAQIGAKEDTLVIGFLGYVYRNKGIETLLQAIASMVASGRDAQLVVLGGRIDIAGVDDGRVSYYDKMQSLSESLGVAQRILWTGTFRGVDQQTASRIYACDVFALPFDEGIHLNNSSFGVLATYGVPVVTTRSPQTDRSIRDGENVLLCPPSDATALADALTRLAGDNNLRRRLSQGAMKLAEAEYSWNEAIDRTLAAIGVHAK